MKTSQTIKIWKRFLKEQLELEEEVLEEEEPFQKAVKKDYLKDRDDYLTSGPQKTGGAPFEKKPKSAPPAGLPVAEDVSLDEGIMDRIKNIFGGRNTAGKSAETASGELNVDLNIKNVSIPLKDDKYPGSGEEALKDPQVLKLAALYKKEIPTVDMASVEKMIKLDPTFGIKTMLGQTDVRNVPPEAKTEPKPMEVSIEKEIMPTFRSEFNDTFYSRKNKYEDIMNSVLGKKVVDETPPEIGVDDFISLVKNKGLDDKEIDVLRQLIGKKKIVKENLSINNVSGTDVAELIENINKFYPYAQEYLKFDRPVSLNLVSDPDNAKDTFGKTAYYNPNNDEVTIFVDKRHPKDMIRSFSHELVHHTQNCRGKRVTENETTTTEEVTTEENVEEAHCPGTRDDEKMEEEVDEAHCPDKEKMEEEAPTSIRESLNKEKGKLIFNRLVDKWCK